MRWKPALGGAGSLQPQSTSSARRTLRTNPPGSLLAVTARERIGCECCRRYGDVESAVVRHPVVAPQYVVLRDASLLQTGQQNGGVPNAAETKTVAAAPRVRPAKTARHGGGGGADAAKVTDAACGGGGRGRNEWVVGCAWRRARSMASAAGPRTRVPAVACRVRRNGEPPPAAAATDNSTNRSPAAATTADRLRQQHAANVATRLRRHAPATLHDKTSFTDGDTVTDGDAVAGGWWIGGWGWCGWGCERLQRDGPF